MTSKYLIKLKLFFLLKIGVIIVTSAFAIILLKDSYFFTQYNIFSYFDTLRFLSFARFEIKEIKNQPIQVCSEGGSVPVLVYHGIVKSPDDVNVTQSNFYKQLSLLKKNGFKSISIEDFIDFKNNGKCFNFKPVLITFDDGRKDSFYFADPILKALSFRATMFLITGITLSDEKSRGKSFYMTELEAKHAKNTGRWDIQSHGDKAHNFEVINKNGDKGHFYSNELYLQKEDRMETADEYRSRVSADFAKSKEKIESKLQVKVDALAFPFGDFGESGNIDNASDVVIEGAEQHYKVGFYQFWPRIEDGYRGNYVGDNKTKLAKRISVTPQLDAHDLVDILDASMAISLPYVENFKNRSQWITVSGSQDSNDQSLGIAYDKGLALIYLDGSYNWKDYAFNGDFQWFTHDEQSISLLARYQSGVSFTSCQFENDAVRIRSQIGQDSVTVAQSELAEGIYNINSNNRLGVTVDGNSIECFINSKRVLVGTVDAISPIGGVGVKVWSPVEREGSVVLYGANVETFSELGQKEKKCASAEEFIYENQNGGKLCIPIASSGANARSKMYKEYPLSADGREVVYSFFDRGNIRAANQMLQNLYPVERYEPFRIEKITWREDPYGEPYWRYIFYSLQPTRHLLAAWVNTGDERYKNKLLEILKGFFESGQEGKFSKDLHGSAYRSMALVNTWWKLRETDALTFEDSAWMLRLIERHGKFLADPANFEPDYNHGIDESIALLVLSIAFPDFPESNNWRQLAESRLSKLLDDIIDDDGALVENSPYYHFYALDKLWDVNKYLKGSELASPALRSKLDGTVHSMIRYATYILQPDQEVPTLGASLRQKINLDEKYKAISSVDSRFKFVLSSGLDGETPNDKSIFYQNTGQTIMRSGWGKGDEFSRATQLIFDVGDYRTNHSDFDALSFHLYGANSRLIIDPGLYTYEDGKYRDYFHGTKSHNTVLVDNKNQKEGSAVPINFIQSDRFTYQSAFHKLYPGVTHNRAIALIEGKYVVVFDKLVSNSNHEYNQRFNLFPTASIERLGDRVVVRDGNAQKKITITQLENSNLESYEEIDSKSPISGICSDEYEIAIPCYSLNAVKNSKNTTFVTLFEIGGGDSPVELVENSENLFRIKIGGDTNYEFEINNPFTDTEGVSLNTVN